MSKHGSMAELETNDTEYRKISEAEYFSLNWCCFGDCISQEGKFGRERGKTRETY